MSNNKNIEKYNFTICQPQFKKRLSLQTETNIEKKRLNVIQMIYFIKKEEICSTLGKSKYINTIISKNKAKKIEQQKKNEQNITRLQFIEHNRQRHKNSN